MIPAAVSVVLRIYCSPNAFSIGLIVCTLFIRCNRAFLIYSPAPQMAEYFREKKRTHYSATPGFYPALFACRKPGFLSETPNDTGYGSGRPSISSFHIHCRRLHRFWWGAKIAFPCLVYQKQSFMVGHFQSKLKSYFAFIIAIYHDRVIIRNCNVTSVHMATHLN